MRQRGREVKDSTQPSVGTENSAHSTFWIFDTVFQELEIVRGRIRYCEFDRQAGADLEKWEKEIKNCTYTARKRCTDRAGCRKSGICVESLIAKNRVNEPLVRVKKASKTFSANKDHQIEEERCFVDIVHAIDERPDHTLKIGTECKITGEGSSSMNAIRPVRSLKTTIQILGSSDSRLRSA
jgi:hypothetical protein